MKRINQGRAGSRGKITQLGSPEAAVMFNSRRPQGEEPVPAGAWINDLESSHVLPQLPPAPGSMLPLDLAEAASMRSKGPSCQLVVIFNRHPSEIHHCLDMERLAAPKTGKPFQTWLQKGEITEEGSKSPFSLSLSLSSRSQGHTWDEGMEMKEWSLKDVISRLGEGEWAGKATDPSWPPFRNLTKKPNYSHIWTMDIKEIHRIPAYTLPVDVKMRYVISHSKRTETLVSLQETAVFLNHLNSSTGIKMSFLFTLSCLLQVHQHLQSSANQTWHPTLGIALYSVQPRSEPTPTIQPSCVWQICCRETLSSFSLGWKSKPEGCFNLRLQCCYRAGRSTEKRIISSMRDGILHHEPQEASGSC